ncbi:MAG: MmcQ/YjbR family DNA-binding protein [Bacteroidetes bacterium]|nr:MmcQ/YjbR family DNA-binding protein [Bacteroidota bacterium]
MTDRKDPTEAIRRKALSFPGVSEGASCTQSAFKVGKGSFLFIGPGPKGLGFKAIFKLKASMSEAEKLAGQHPARFEVGKTGWVTARFTAEEPLPESIWSNWLAESYAITSGTVVTTNASEAD